MGIAVHLPSELVDQICSYLDKRALATCTLTCRQWYAVARTLLYHTIVVRDKRDGDSSHTMPNLLRFLISSSASRISWCIKCLMIRGIVSFNRNTSVSASQLQCLLFRLPSLRILQLEHVLLQLGSPDEPDYMNSGPHLCLDELRLEHVAFEIQGIWDTKEVPLSLGGTDVKCSIVELFALFTSLKTLFLSSVQPLNDPRYDTSLIMDMASAAGQSIERDFRITRLVSRSSYAHGYVLAVLRGSHCLDALRSLDIQDAPVKHFNALLQAVSGTLHDLRLQVLYGSFERDVVFDVACCKRLCTLSFVILLVQPQADDELSRGFLDMLDVITRAPSGIVRLTIHMKCHRYSPKTIVDRLAIPWDAFDGSLENRGPLEQVYFDMEDTSRPMRGAENPSAMLDQEVVLLREYLPRCQAKGLLKFRCQVRAERSC